LAAIHPDADKFLNRRARFGVVTTLRSDGSACTVPLWYDWDGTAVRFFSGATSAKLKRLENDPRISLTVSSEVDEGAEIWVSFEGLATVSKEGAKDLAVLLARRYLGDVPVDPRAQEMKASFEEMPETYVRQVHFVPTRGFAMLGDDKIQKLFID